MEINFESMHEAQLVSGGDPGDCKGNGHGPRSAKAVYLIEAAIPDLELRIPLRVTIPLCQRCVDRVSKQFRA